MAFDMPQPVHTPRSERFRAAVLAGLAAPQKAVPPLFFYDDRGSELFESIKSSDDYYVTRAETAALLGAVGTLARIDAGALVELGAGTGRRLEILLRSLPGLRAFCPVDLSIVQLALSEGDAADSGRRIAIAPLLADFAEPFVLPPDVPGPRLAYFPGSSIGNFQPLGAQRLLSQLRASLGAGSQLLICVDLLKDARRLERAYDDRSGHTAAFNLNLLRRINRELDGAFALENFGHEARFNPEQGRIEMHLRCLRDHEVQVAGQAFAFARGESIHTENAYKYSPEAFRQLANLAGWAAVDCWFDPDGLVSLHLLRA